MLHYSILGFASSHGTHVMLLSTNSRQLGTIDNKYCIGGNADVNWGGHIAV